jgi:uncharacterized protein
MKVLVVSDSHGEAQLLHAIIRRVAADHVIHCGDFCTKREELPDVSLTVVKGNCDFAQAPKEQIWKTGKLRFYVVHGHQLRVKSTLLPLRGRAEEVGAQIVCFGHSHFPVCQQVKNVLLLNPGSIASPRQFPYPTYACIEIWQHRVHVTYYKTEGEKVDERGGSFDFGKQAVKKQNRP